MSSASNSGATADPNAISDYNAQFQLMKASKQRGINTPSKQQDPEEGDGKRTKGAIKAVAKEADPPIAAQSAQIEFEWKEEAAKEPGPTSVILPGSRTTQQTAIKCSVKPEDQDLAAPRLQQNVVEAMRVADPVTGKPLLVVPSGPESEAGKYVIYAPIGHVAKQHRPECSGPADECACPRAMTQGAPAVSLRFLASPPPAAEAEPLAHPDMPGRQRNKEQQPPHTPKGQPGPSGGIGIQVSMADVPQPTADQGQRPASPSPSVPSKTPPVLISPPKRAPNPQISPSAVAPVVSSSSGSTSRPQSQSSQSRTPLISPPASSKAKAIEPERTFDAPIPVADKNVRKSRDELNLKSAKKPVISPVQGIPVAVPVDRHQCVSPASPSKKKKHHYHHHHVKKPSKDAEKEGRAKSQDIIKVHKEKRDKEKESEKKHGHRKDKDDNNDKKNAKPEPGRKK